MKLGVNDAVNPGTKKVGLQLMERGPSKINPPNSHPSNPIHKAATAAQTTKPASKQTPTLLSDEIEETFSEKTLQHEVTAVIVGVVGVVALMFMALG